MIDTRLLRLVLWALTVLCVTGCDLRLSQTTLPTPSPSVAAQVLPTATSAPRPTDTPPPPPTAVPIPPRPQDFEQYASTIVAYLNDSKGDEDGLRSLLEGWEALRHVTDLLRVDVDDDGTGEFLLVVVDPSPEYGINARGDLLVIDRDNETFRLAYTAAGDSVLTDPALLEVDDLNEDGYTEIAFSSTSCGAHTCFTTVYVVSSGTGTYDDLTNGGVEMSYAEPSFQDWDGDGTRALIMHGGTIGSVGAGPQRARTEVYKWNGTTYVPSETVYDYSNYLYFKVLDANQALVDGEYERATILYREAIDDHSLQTWMEGDEREELTAFSRYRLSLTYLMMGEAGMAQAARDELLSAQPENIYAQAATILWDAYTQDGDLREACEQVGTFAEDHPETIEVLADYGYGNPTFTPQEVCPLSLFP
jgi:hypothetical protein